MPGKRPDSAAPGRKQRTRGPVATGVVGTGRPRRPPSLDVNGLPPFCLGRLAPPGYVVTLCSAVMRPGFSLLQSRSASSRTSGQRAEVGLTGPPVLHGFVASPHAPFHNFLFVCIQFECERFGGGKFRVLCLCHLQLRERAQRVTLTWQWHGTSDGLWGTSGNTPFAQTTARAPNVAEISGVLVDSTGCTY